MFRKKDFLQITKWNITFLFSHAGFRILRNRWAQQFPYKLSLQP